MLCYLIRTQALDNGRRASWIKGEEIRHATRLDVDNAVLIALCDKKRISIAYEHTNILPIQHMRQYAER